MNRWSLVASSIAHHRRAHLGVLLGVMVACATVVGSLSVGDSIEASLRARVDQRLGGVSHVLDAGTRTVSEALAERLDAAPVLLMEGVLARSDGARAQGRVRVYGVDDRFYKLVNVSAPTPSTRDDVPIVLSRSLARELDLLAGDEAVFRSRRPESAPEELSLADREKARISFRVRIEDVSAAKRLESFAVRQERDRFFNAYVPLSILQATAGTPGRVNLLLGKYREGSQDDRLRGAISPEDLGLDLMESPAGVELRARHVFIDPAVARAADSLTGGERSFGYLANALRAGDRSAPYAVVAGLDTHQDLAADEMVVSDWLARDLGVKVGERVAMAYFAMNGQGALEERSASFEVREIVATERLDGSLLPAIPGISGKTHCRDWEPGFPFDATRIREKDEAYWQRYGGTPKAVISFRAAQALWGNRFGDRTKVRWPSGRFDEVRSRLVSALDPAALELRFVSAKAEAYTAAKGSSDLRGLFLGFGFFLVLAALLLAGVLMALGASRRADERRALAAMGFTPGEIHRLFLTESALVALAGSILGLPCGVIYSVVVLGLIEGPWRGAAHLSSLVLDIRAASAWGGVAATAGAALVATWLALRPARWRASIPARFLRGLLVLSLVAGAGAIWWGVAAENPIGFFVSGALFLLAGSVGFRLWLHSLGIGGVSRNLVRFGLRNLGRNPGRSMAVFAMVAAPTFLVVAVGASRPALPDLSSPEAPTGGFAYVARTTLPIFEDIPGAVGFRVHEGDDASCLTLDQAKRPEILGVDPARLSDHFRFIHGEGWDDLDMELPGGMVPAVADETTVRWMLHKQPNEEIPYVDEMGREFQVRIVGILADSILQGRLIVSEARFVEHFPREGGRRLFLVDAPADAVDAAMQGFAERFVDRGPVLERASGLLHRLHAVEETYLAIFGALGAIGLMLGALGLGALVWRHAEERRRELAFLRATGFTPARVTALLVIEHVVVFVAAVLAGLSCAGLAIAPQLARDLPPFGIWWQVGGVLGAGVIATLVAGILAGRAPPMTDLRGE